MTFKHHKISAFKLLSLTATRLSQVLFFLHTVSDKFSTDFSASGEEKEDFPKNIL